MLESSDKDHIQKKINEVKIFSVPFPVIENQTNLSINTNHPSKPSKD